MNTPPLVFILDDDPAFLAIMAQVLKKYAVASETFKTSNEFLSRLAVKAPDLCCIDLNVESAASGLSIIKSVREKTAKYIPLIMVTTESDPIQIAHALETGADDYIFKPLNRDVLTAKILDYFQTQELEFSKMIGTTELELDIPIDLINRVSIIQIDELGLSLLSPHLLPKGLVIRLEAQILQTVTKRPGSILLTVSDAKLETQNPPMFKIDFEFDQTDTELLNAVRHWVTQ